MRMVGTQNSSQKLSCSKSDAQRKRDSAQPQDAQRKRDSAQPQDAQRKRDSAQPQDAQRKRDSAQPQERTFKMRNRSLGSVVALLGILALAQVLCAERSPQTPPPKTLAANTRP